MTQFSRTTALCLISLLSVLAGCSGNSSSSSRSEQVVSSVNGYVGAANINNAAVQAVSLDSGQLSLSEDGQSFVGSAIRPSSPNGYYSLTIPTASVNKSLIVVATARAENKTTIRCELPDGCGDGWGYRSYRPLSEDVQMRAGIGVARNNAVIQINWLTHLAAAYAYASYGTSDECGLSDEECLALPDVPRMGFFTAYTIERANLWIARLFQDALEPGTDLLSLRPIAPSLASETSTTMPQLKRDGIILGAILAGMQKLAIDANKTEDQWVTGVAENYEENEPRVPGLVDALLNNQGGLYEKKEGEEYTLYSIYNAAHDVLSKTRTHFLLMQINVPAELDQAITKLQIARDAMDDDELKVVVVNDVEVARLASWAAIMRESESFIDDLQERLFNFKGDMPNTCVEWSSAPQQSCKDSFIDPAYVAKTVEYYEQFEEVYRNHGHKLDAALQDIRDGVLTFSECLNAVSCADPDYNATSRSFTTKFGVQLTAIPVTQLLKPGTSATDEKKYKAFDFQITGTQTLGDGYKIQYKSVSVANSQGVEAPQYARMRVEYEDFYPQPPFAGVDDGMGNLVPAGATTEPVFFDLLVPNAEITLPGLGRLESSFAFKLNGVNDPLVGDVNQFGGRYHFNVSELGFLTTFYGRDITTVKDVGDGNKIEFSLAFKSNNSANYYSDTVWPSLDDFFEVRSDLAADSVVSDLIQYSYFDAKPVVVALDASNEPVYADAEVFEFEVSGLGINRYELFLKDGKKTFKRCIVLDRLPAGDTPEDPDNAASDRKACTAATEQAADFTLINSVIYPESDQKNALTVFAVPSRGAYEIMYPADINEFKAGSTLDGKLVAAFRQGVDQLNVRMAHDLYECEYLNVGNPDLPLKDFCITENQLAFQKAPKAIVDARVIRQTEEDWSLSVSAGYDFGDYVSPISNGLLMLGQSLYLSYSGFEYTESKGNESINKVAELVSVIIHRGGYSLGNGATVNLAGLASYEIDTATGVKPCGLYDRDTMSAKDGSCSSVIYLTFRGYLVAAIREERQGVFVVRYSNGRFKILGG